MSLSSILATVSAVLLESVTSRTILAIIEAMAVTSRTIVNTDNLLLLPVLLLFFCLELDFQSELLSDWLLKLLSIGIPLFFIVH